MKKFDSSVAQIAGLLIRSLKLSAFAAFIIIYTEFILIFINLYCLIINFQLMAVPSFDVFAMVDKAENLIHQRNLDLLDPEKAFAALN